MTHHSKGIIEECSQVMQIIAIIWLYLTVYSQYFSKVFL